MLSNKLDQLPNPAIPLLKPQKLTPPGGADIYVKYEGANPTGSMKAVWLCQ
jgi:cysteine synthase